MAETRGGRPINSGSSRPTGGDKAVMGKKQYFRRKKMCRFFAVDKIDDINYKDVRLLHSFISERGKITPSAHLRESAAAAPAAAIGGSHQAGTQYRADPVCDVDVKKGTRYMEVILREEIEKLGRRGDVVKVAAGYARNYLLPKRLAVAANESNKKIVEQEKQAYLRRESKEIGDANDLAKMMGSVEVTIAQKAGENDQLFGSVTAQDIVAALERAGYTIDRKKVNLAEPIKALGDYKVTVRLHREVSVEPAGARDQGRIVSAVRTDLGPGASPYELLEAAARGRIGVDRRFLHSIVDRGAPTETAAEILRFSRSPQDPFPINVDPLLTDLFRHFGTEEALEFYVDAIRRAPEDVDDSLIQALLPFAEKAAGPLLALYEELGEEQGSDVAFLLAALRVRDPRVLKLLLDRLDA